MCGIWSSIGFQPQRDVINAVAHRGPDDEGWQEFDTDAGRLVLAHKRLSIIDLSKSGHQPMPSASARYWIVFNGEIYNYVELREELIGCGHKFKSRSDTEVILTAYCEWGEGCLNRFNGMFAFVIWDAQEKAIFAARDRFGIKPLYAYQDADGVAFASEIKQFTHLKSFRAVVNTARAYDFLTYGLFDHNGETLFQGVSQVQAGECVLIGVKEGLAGKKVEVRRWYERTKIGEMKLPAVQAIDDVRQLLDDSIRLHLRSDVPVGSCLSGGLDSSTIVCLAAPQVDQEFVTISACYDGFKDDESYYIDVVNETVTTGKRRVFPQGEDLAREFETIVYHQDGPFGSPSVFAQWEVFSDARKAGISVMLDGQGADELLAGYHLAYGIYQAEQFKKSHWLALYREMRAERNKVGTAMLFQISRLVYNILPGKARAWSHSVRGISHPSWLQYRKTSQDGNPLPWVTSPGGLLETQLFKTSLPMLLHYEDRNSMAFGIESRLPFLDFRLAELLMGLDARHKIVDGETKWLLRQAMKGVLPDKIANRHDKLAFATPEEQWLKGPLRETVEREIKEVADRFPDIFRGDELRKKAISILDGNTPYDRWLWRVVSFSVWGRVFGVAAQ